MVGGGAECHRIVFLIRKMYPGWDLPLPPPTINEIYFLFFLIFKVIKIRMNLLL